MNRKQVIRINERQLRNIVSESVRRVLGEAKRGFGDWSNEIPERGFYLCSETDYNQGGVNYWVGDEYEACLARQCSEGGAYGPFDTPEQALRYARRRWPEDDYLPYSEERARSAREFVETVPQNGHGF